MCTQQNWFYIIEDKDSDFHFMHTSLTSVLSLVEAGEPNAVQVRASGHAAEVASAGGSWGGRLSDWGGGQRPDGGTHRGGHEGLAEDSAKDG